MSSNTSIRPIPTLRGMFSVPRVTHSRNFLKENKLSLRSLEKATTEKLAAKEPVRPKWMPPLCRSASFTQERKRCVRELEKPTPAAPSEHEKCLMRSNSEVSEYVIPKHGERFDNIGGRDQINYESQIREPQVSQRRVPPPHQDRAPPLPLHYHRGSSPFPHQKTTHKDERCTSCGKDRSSTSIGIQTEDIMDETYLSDALRKCNFDGKSMINDDRSIRKEGGSDYLDKYKNYSQYGIEEEQPLSARTNFTTQTKHNQFSTPQFGMDQTKIMPLPDGHDQTSVNGFALDEEAPLSARSRDTIVSNVTTKSKRREHKLGSRDELRLPRYLEREKRDKAEAVQREMSRDPDCPRGHVLLSEHERLSHLHSAKQRFDMLINEMNHLPMTAQTLRVRTRKAEIDKELSSAEDEIRVYSKPKVYVRVAISRSP